MVGHAITIALDTSSANPESILLNTGIDNNNIYTRLIMHQYTVYTTDGSDLSEFYTVSLDLTRMTTISNNTRITNGILLMCNKGVKQVTETPVLTVSTQGYWKDRLVSTVRNSAGTVVTNVKVLITFDVQQQ